MESNPASPPSILLQNDRIYAHMLPLKFSEQIEGARPDFDILKPKTLLLLFSINFLRIELDAHSLHYYLFFFLKITGC